MLKAVKGNKVYKIDETAKKRYLEDGYDIYEDKKLIESSPKKEVKYADYKKLENAYEMLNEDAAEVLKQKEELEKKVAELESSANNEELVNKVAELEDALKKQESTNAELVKANEEFVKSNEKLTKQIEKLKGTGAKEE
jgi:hypothetical protein